MSKARSFGDPDRSGKPAASAASTAPGDAIGAVDTETRLWPGRADVPDGPLHLWFDGAGEPVTGADGASSAVVSTTASPDAADAPPGARPQRFEDFAALLAAVPAGAGVVVDAATADRRVLSPLTVAGLRTGAVPRGDERDLAASSVPAHLAPVVEAAAAASAQAGVKHVAAAWAARSSGPGVLLIMLSARAGLPASLAALDAAAAAVERQAPAEPVRVVLTSVLGVARAVSFSKAGLPRRSPSGERRGRNGFHVLPAVAAVLLGVLVLAVPHWAGWHGAAAIATYVVGGFLAMAGAGAALSGGAGRKAEAGGPPAGGG